ncbi:MAG: DUF445 family protein [Rubricoccaceae bacterium]|nr:DUF445 family protein [Rubricoccaceae bacterium]
MHDPKTSSDSDKSQPAPPGRLTPVPGVVDLEESEDAQREASLTEAQTATREKLREAGNLVVKYGREHWPEQTRSPEKQDWEPPRLVGRIGKVLPYMRVIPWLLTGLFVTSFFWDFPGMAISVFGDPISIEGLLRIVSVSGLIGFFTNWLAITMLFQPREKRAIIPQGLIPAQRERVIYRLAEAVSQELINEDIIKAKIHESGVITRYRDLAISTVRGVVEDEGFRSELKSLTAGYVQEVFGSEGVRKQLAALAVEKVEQQAGRGLGGMALRMYRTFAEDDFQRRVDEAISDIPNAVTPLLDNLDSALDRIPERIESRADDIEETVTRIVLSFVEGLDVRTMIVENARNYDEAHLERILKTTSNEQLTYIKYLGGVLGLFGGLVIWQPVLSLGAFAVLGLLLWATDEAVVRMRQDGASK